MKSRARDPARLLSEIQAMASLKHPNAAELVDVHEDEKYVHLITPLYSGGDLLGHIVGQGKFKEAEARRVMRQVLGALAHAHARGVVHRDLKPDNIVFESEAAGSPVRVIDFGMARVAAMGPGEKEGGGGGGGGGAPRKGEALHMCSFVGTPLFMAPQVLLGRYDHKCDQWSAGAVLHVLLVGYPPFLGQTAPAVCNLILNEEPAYAEEDFGDVSPPALDLLKALLCKEAARRPEAAEALRHPWFGAA